MAALACLLWLGCLGYAMTSYAQLQLETSASIIRNFARISFKHNEPMKLRTANKGRQIRLRFDQPVEVNPAPLLGKLRPYVISISQSEDKRSLLLTTNREYRTRSFVSGNSSGIDIIGLQKGGVQEPPKEEPPVVEKEAVKEPLPQVRPAAKPEPAVETKPAPEPEAKPKPEPEPIPAVEEAEPAPVQEETKDVVPVAPIPAVEPAVVEEAEQQEPAETTQEPVVEQEEETPPAVAVEPETPAEPAPAASAEETAPPMAEVRPEAIAAAEQEEQAVQEAYKAKAPPGKVTVAKLEDEDILLTFPWAERVAATVFRRDKRVLLLFNAEQDFDLSAVKASPQVKSVSTLKIPGKNPAQLWVLETDMEGVEVSREKENYQWQIALRKTASLPKKLLKPQPKVEPPLRPHLFIPILQLAPPVKFYDPLVGDELTAIPFFQAGIGLVPPRHFAEFSMLRSEQGIVINNAMPYLRIARTRAGLKITAPDGIMISKDLPPVQLPEPEVAESEASDTFFPYQNWLPPEDEQEEPFEFENRLWRQTATLDKKKKRIARRRLAELYLAQGKAQEAKTILQLLAQESPIYFTRNRLYALLGAAHFLSYEFLPAETAFKHATIEKEPELDFWRDTLNVLIRGEGEADYQAYHDKYIRYYPPIMRQRLALVAADNYINRKKYNKALKIFDTLHKDHMLEDVQDHVQFLIARVLAGTTQKDAARLMWQKLADKTENRYIRPRALFAITNLNLAENKVSIEEAIAQLEPLRIIWRGDRFEISLLNLLTRLYEEVGQYREALRTYREIVTYFPNNPDNLEITGKMADIFRKLFNEGGADSLSPLQALALYYEFRNLTPIGKEGDQMIQNLADRLMAVELLDRAAALLQHQVEFRLSGEERSRVGARLALIHLLRRKPREALNVLELTGFGGNPENLQQQRTLLTARALMGLGEPERAEALLEGDESREARLLQLSLYWKEQQWPKLIQVAETLMGQREDPSAPLDEGEVDVLMKLAIGYVFEQQRGQLQYLRDYFLPLVKDESARDLFSFITEDTKLDYRNIAKLTAQIGRMEAFLSSYRDKIKKGGLSNAVE